MTKRRRKTLLQTTGYSVFPVLMVMEEEDDGRTMFRPIPLGWAILRWWLSLLLATWLQEMRGTTQKIVDNTGVTFPTCRPTLAARNCMVSHLEIRY